MNHFKNDRLLKYYDKDDDYLQILSCGKLEEMNYIKTDEWDEFKTDLKFRSYYRIY